MPNREYRGIRPKRMASWWCTLEDLHWPQTKVIEKIKRRAAEFAESGIDTAVNFGFHNRFDFSNYFDSLHGYYHDVCEELHQNGIRYMGHYSCNVVERPRTKAEFYKLHAAQRHHVLLPPDERAAAFAQYEGFFYRDLCEVDLRDGSRGYTDIYQGEIFCHNNPDFIEMNRRYLKRLIEDVPMDGIMIDNMCDYAFLATCGCEYCREKFRKTYGHDLPPLSDQSFWGNTDAHPSLWGNYDNPVFRDWIRFKADTPVEHLKVMKETLGDIPLMTCCSSTGPIRLNAIGLNLERISGDLDLVMLENCGTGAGTVNWVRMDAEALQQKDIAEKMGHAPAIALSYFIFEPGAYLGWALSRFWGVANWSSTLFGRLEREPDEPAATHDLIRPYNIWEQKHSELDLGGDIPELRIASNILCRENGFRDENGEEHWTKISEWSRACVEHNIGYRFVRANELTETKTLLSEDTPLILDGVGCVSNAQYQAICEFLRLGGKAVVRLPFGTHDENGFIREMPLSDELLTAGYQNLIIAEDKAETMLPHLIKTGLINPVITQFCGDPRWALRVRQHQGNLILHLLNRALEAVPSSELKNAMMNEKILESIQSNITDHHVEYILDFSKTACPIWKTAYLLSPETGDEKQPVKIETLGENKIKISADLSPIKIYGVIQ
ncbi:MAG TPA: hypothetical protein PK629_08660 [Oscillospiraceae bacterium]|nr:hypothetical protein [Oscillospiraceae bacterium]HPK35552.1 hypothetical protein [Oscillospiraceae bacterium]HPR75914.1 hypothetical protein [Oscillospiraceae bacterium]